MRLLHVSTAKIYSHGGYQEERKVFDSRGCVEGCLVCQPESRLEESNKKARDLYGVCDIVMETLIIIQIQNLPDFFF